MKKQVINYETKLWAGYDIINPFEVFDAMIAYASIDYYKKMLSDAILYAQKQEVYNKEEPVKLFMYHVVLRSFFRACSKMESKSKKWKVQQTNSDCKSVLHQASLNEEEYNNPFTVFKNAFAENSVKDYEYFCSSMVEMALSHHQLDYDPDLFAYYIQIVKLLDAAQLIRERGIEKSKKEATPADVMQQETNAVEQQDDKNQITTIITSALNTCGIYCFGQRKTKEAQESVYAETQQTNATHYYMLVIVPTLPQNATADLAYRIKTQTRGRCTATLLIHTFRDVRRDKIKQASFFQKIIFEGVTWFEDWSSTTPLQLADTSKRQHKEIESYWLDRKIIVDGLMDAVSNLNPNNTDLLKITFLHQAVEQLCLGLIHTFLGYRPHHFGLGYLFELCDLFTPIAAQLFPRSTKEDVALFHPLFRSINDMRHFKIMGKSTPQLPLIEQRCLAFCEQTKILIAAELERLKSIE